MGAAGLLLLLLAATCYATGRSSPVDKLYSPHTGPLLRDRVAARRLPALPRPSSPRPSPAVLEEALGATANPFPFGLADPVPPQRHPEHNKHTASKLRAGGETRLPTHVVPTRYKIVIAPELEKGYFIATTDIYLNVLQPTTSIVLNAVDLNLMGVEMHRYSGEFDKYFKYGSATIRTASSDTEGQITVELSQGLVPGEHYLLRFPEFVPYLRTDLAGFYLSSYKDGDGRTRLLGVTQFESNAARMAFPCFDEPTFKARFKIIIEHPQDLGVRSNMPIIRQTQPALTMIRTEFDESLPMSTYLVAWTVSDFQGYSDFSGFTTWARADLLQNEAGILLGQRVGPAVLREMEEFTGIPYALPKVDQFAIPDFAAGAMENWGLVTYREPYLIETKETDVRIRHFIGTTVCHELGHQWTGNLVTLDWWSNTWLNEGFATYFESVICDQILPEWDLMDMFVPEAVHVAIANDVIPNQLAMSSPIPDDNLATTKFDRISYKKGGSVLRMFEHMIGTEVFKGGLERYLRINALKNGSPESLFRAMQAEVQKAGVKLPEGATFQDVAKSWTEQSGVPVLHAKRNYDQGSIVFSQEQFLYETPSVITEKKWYIPIPLPVNPKMVDPWTSTLPEFWLTPDTKTKEVDVDAAKSEWVLINPKQIGYYLVNYDEANWKLLLAALTSQPNNNDIHPASRAQLLHDVMALARAGHVKYTTALPFLQTLSVETAVAPWKAAVDAIAFLRDRLASSQAAAVLQRFVRDLTEEGYGKLGFVRNTDPADPDNTRYLRYYVASLACWAGHSPCTRDAERALEAHLRDGAGMDADTATAAWCYGVRDSKTNFERVLQLWQDGKDPTSQATHAAALSCTSDQEQLRRILDGLLDPSSSRSTEKASLFINSILQRWEHHHFLVEYYKQNWSKISAYGGSDYHITILKALIRDVRSEEEHEDMVALVKSVVGSSTSSLSGELTASLESAKKGLSWQRSNYQAVTDWLYAATNTSPPTTPAPAPAPSSTEPPATTATATPSSATQTSFAVGLIFGGLLAQRLWN